MKLTREAAEKIYEKGKEQVVKELVEMSEALSKISERMAELERRMKENSENSHRPPSQDGYRKPAPQSQREKSEKKSGGQAGHEGKTLQLMEKVEHEIEHWPSICEGCGKELEEGEGIGYTRRQVHDVPEMKIEVTEHRSMQVKCSGCGKTNSGVYPAGVNGHVQYGSGVKALAVYSEMHHMISSERTVELLRDTVGVEVSEGTLWNSVQEAGELVAPYESAIKQSMEVAEVVRFDESGVRVAEHLEWLHVASTEQATYYAVDEKRGSAAHQRIGILPNFQGVAVHDAYASYLKLPMEHALCNAHLLRDLKAVSQMTQQTWPQQLILLLLNTKAAVHQAKADGLNSLSPQQLLALDTDYHAFLAQAHSLNPRPPPQPGQRGRQPASFAANLAQRLTTHKNAILRFACDFRVPFDNNLAERDLRMMKLKLKVSGSFRSKEGAHLFAAIRSFISTARKQGFNALASLRSLFNKETLALQLC
jgi:transposase